VPPRYRTIWISDVHLGLRSSKAEALLHFLATHDADRYYLVGDIIDGWALRRSWYWPPSHDEVIRRLLERSQRSEMVYIPGNHDAVARRFSGLRVGDVQVRSHAVHTTADDRALLVLHGDEFDGPLRHASWLSRLGGWAYRRLLALDRHVNRVRRWLDRPHWRLAAAAKTRTKQAVQYVAHFEEALTQRARRQEVDGVVCGHVHMPELRAVEDLTYANTGDWVEHCTALVEHEDGTLALRDSPPDAGSAYAGDGTTDRAASLSVAAPEA
jgi:UDP-2,3-diacylglucosamine pyrophosphatase LpxH